MDTLISVEKDYGYPIAIAASIVAAVMFKYGYEDYAPSGSDIAKEDHKTRGIILMTAAIIIIGGSWWLAYNYQKL